MRNILLFLAFLSISCTLQAQSTRFQQKVDYKINVTLDDKTHRLTGEVTFTYTNNAPTALNEIWVHLWGNAFADRTSAFTKQKLKDGNTKLYFAPEEELGGYSGLDFKANFQTLKWKLDAKHKDIALVKLEQPLESGKSITITTPFSLKIPASFSRLGHVAETYQMTQWYPKPAVYDHKGWHAMPYLDQGEFYSEFGDYEVQITLPENYVVGATGICMNTKEQQFLATKAQQTKEWIATGKLDNFNKIAESSSETPKTLKYIATNVHDFAWFADKRFMVLKDTAHLASGKTVACWAMFPPEDAAFWQKGHNYVRRAVEFYSENVGEYPYPQATAVLSALSAGGGMEYPMITVIGNAGSASSLDEVITHEVGHNWFYGILASNERDHAWLDEGLNTFYENRYMKKHYGITGLNIQMPRKLKALISAPLEWAGTNILQRSNVALPPDTHSDRFSNIQYGLMSYVKPGILLKWLEESVGIDKLDAAMKSYYQNWKFKHPYPEDFWQSLEASGLQIEWLKDEMMTRKKTDYAFKNLQKQGENYQITVKNTGRTAAPFPISATKGGVVTSTLWFDPIAIGEKATLQFPSSDTIDAFILDANYHTLDANRANNYLKTSGSFKTMRPLKVRMVAGMENAQENTIGILPYLNWNAYDKVQIGAVIHNAPVPESRFNYTIMPSFATGSNSLTGKADLNWSIFPQNNFRRISFGIEAKSYHYDYNFRDEYFSRYYRVVPSLTFEFTPKNATFTHQIQFRTLLIGEENGQYDTTGFLGAAYQNSLIHELRYSGEQTKYVRPYNYTVALEQQSYKDAFDADASYLKASAEWSQKFYYAKGKKVKARVFGAFFLQNDKKESGSVFSDLARGSLTLTPQGYTDYKYDQFILGRSENRGILSRQVTQTDGGFKSAFGAPFAGILGNSNSYVFALNLKADLPKRLPLGLPLKPYFDIGYFDDSTPIGKDRPSSEKLIWSGGVALSFFEERLEVYFPIASSKQIGNLYDEKGSSAKNNFLGYLNWISWSINLEGLSPLGVMRRFVR